MSRIQLSALAYMTKLAYFHCEFSFAFYTLPEEVNDDNEKKIQAMLDLISDYADFNEGHMINTTLYPPSSKSDTTFVVIDILMTKINRYQKAILNKTRSYKNTNIVVLEQPSQPSRY
jgi:chlorite dismutase